MGFINLATQTHTQTETMKNTSFDLREIASGLESGLFHHSGLPIGEATARAWFAALWAEALRHGLVHRPLSEDVVPTYVRVYSDDAQSSGYVYIPVAATDHSGTCGGLYHTHPLVRLIRRMASRSPYLRGYVQDRLQRVRPATMQTAPQTFRARTMTRPLTPAAYRYDRAVGVELELLAPCSEAQLVEALPLWCRRAHDGSLRGEAGYSTHEIRALLMRSEAEPRLYRLCRILSDLGCKVNKSCGLHVHLDQRGESADAVRKRATIVNAWLERLQELVPASRRSNDYCKWGISATDRYRAVNLTSYAKYGTLEIRLHSGTVDYTKVLAWIRLCELLAAMRSKPKTGGCIATLEQLPLASHDLAYWRARHRALNPHLYTDGNATSEQE